MEVSPTTLMPVEEYLRLTEKPNCDYRDGVLTPKPMPTTFHGLLEFMLVAMLRKLDVRSVESHTIRTFSWQNGLCHSSQPEHR